MDLGRGHIPENDMKLHKRIPKFAVDILDTLSRSHCFVLRYKYLSNSGKYVSVLLTFWLIGTD